MLRALILGLALASALAGAAQAEEERDGLEPVAPYGELRREGDFIRGSDACGASAYDHLVGENYGEMLEAALIPSESVIAGREPLTTLEYTPAKLNVVLDGAGRIAAIGCF